MARNKPLTCKEVKKILTNLGFSFKKQKGSHEQWTNEGSGKDFRKVTVDCPKQPFGQDLIRHMANQAGVSKRAFYKALNK